MSKFQRHLLTVAAVIAMTTIKVTLAVETLPTIGAAPEFALTTQDNRPLSLGDLHGKVVAVTFIFTQCRDTCPVLTAKLVDVQRKLSNTADSNIAFVAISLTPTHDTSDVLKRYANAHNADLARWSFLTGDEKQIHLLAKQYGVFVQRKDKVDEVDHGFLTSLIDRAGMIRVQYMGVRFAPDEMLSDLRALAQEPPSK